MKVLSRIFILFITVFGLILPLNAHPVDLETAQAVASKFMKTEDLQLSVIYQTERHDAAFFIFNTNDGFVIVSADDCETPIIGYSHEGRFDPNDIPIQMQGYLQHFVERIQYGIEHQINADETTLKQWDSVKTIGQLSNRNASNAVAPLLTTKWNQGCFYNSLCPAIGSQPCGHAEVGCVAVAMGQIMRYWNYPTMGWGSHSYSHAGATLSADFGGTTYDWDHMPNTLSEASSEAEINAVATLLYHCGVSVDMRYNSNSSMADPSSVPDAMRRYFNYSRQIHTERQSNYDNEAWSNLLKSCLDLGRPIHYTGYGSAGHSFVCDGYDADGLFHFNWGWSAADGYFAIGNLNPNGYDFNISNSAILDIYPQYEPCLVFTTAYPSSAGSIEGCGEYHVGERCTLSANPTEGYMFYHWKKDGIIQSNDPSYTFTVEEDTVFLEAHFSCFPVGQITAHYAPEANNPNSPNVGLSWSRADTDWKLLKQFPINGESGGLATDGKHIYITYGDWTNPTFSFEKYTMDGVLEEQFNLEGVPSVLCLAYDGTNFYCNDAKSGYEVLYRVDLDDKTIIDSTKMPIWFAALTYDPVCDGFWLGKNYQTILFDRQGQRIQTSPLLPDYINSTGYFTAKDGMPHLLLSRASGVYDYDISNNVILDRPLLDFEDNNSMGACTALYDGKEAMFIVVDSTVQIYEIKSRVEQIVGYRIYRVGSEGAPVMIANEVGGVTYTDTSWDNLEVGWYRFGISEVYANGNESEIMWSDPIEKKSHGINENVTPLDPTVQKFIENGHIVIVKDGKRYNINGQEL